MNPFFLFKNLLFVLFFCFISGCVISKKGYISHGETIYEMEKKSEFKILLNNESTPPLPSEVAGKLALSKDIIIAFYPPNKCVSTTSESYSSTRQKNVLQIECGVLMSTLQNHAQKKGFNVVSWQQLIGSKRPIDYAKEYKVDFLFELNEIGINDNKYGIVQNTEFSFKKIYSDKHKKIVDLSLDKNQKEILDKKCKDFFSERSSDQQITASLNANMVDVNSGKVLWSYKREIGIDKKEKWETIESYQWKVLSKGTKITSVKNDVASVMGTLATVSLLLGASFIGTGIALEAGIQGYNFSLIWGTGIGLVGLSSVFGLVALVYYIQQPIPIAKKPSPPSVDFFLCDKEKSPLSNALNINNNIDKKNRDKNRLFARNKEKIDKLIDNVIIDFLYQLKK